MSFATWARTKVLSLPGLLDPTVWISGGLAGGLRVGLARLFGTGAARVAVDAVVTESSVGLTEGLGAQAGTQISKGALRAMERQLETAGRRSLEGTIRTLTGNIAEHEARMAEYRAAGGFTSAMETEVAAWRDTIAAAKQVLGIK